MLSAILLSPPRPIVESGMFEQRQNGRVFFSTHARIVFDTLPQGYPILYSVPLVVVPLPALR